MSTKLSTEDALQRYSIKQNKNLLKLGALQKILQKHEIPNTCPIKEVVLPTCQEGLVTVKRLRPIQEGVNVPDPKTNHIYVEQKQNKVSFHPLDP